LEGRREALCSIIDRYNQIIEECETDLTYLPPMSGVALATVPAADMHGVKA